MTAPAQPVKGVEAVATRRLAVARAICTAMGDDWEREGPGDVLLEAYGPLADAAIAALTREAPAAVAEAVCPVPPLYADRCTCPQHASPAVTPAMVNAAWNEGKNRRMTGLPTDFRAVLEAALATQADATKGDA